MIYEFKITSWGTCLCTYTVEVEADSLEEAKDLVEDPDYESNLEGFDTELSDYEQEKVLEIEYLP